MEITVISEEDNPMLHRTDVQFRVSHAEATPDRLAVRDSLAARLNKDADEVVIRRLDTKFGMRETVGEAKVYQSADFATDVEQDHMLARNKIGDAVAVEAAPEADAELEEEAATEDEEPADEAGEPEAADEEGEPDEDAAEEPEAEDDVGGEADEGAAEESDGEADVPDDEEE